MKRSLNLVLTLLYAFGTTQCSSISEQSFYFIPNYFVGNVIVAFGHSDGAPIEYRDGVRIYRIPANGILKTQFLANYGLREPSKYFYTNSKGKIVKFLQYFSTTKDAPVYAGSTDTICLHAQSIKDAMPVPKHYYSFLVSTVASSDSLYEQSNKMTERVK